MADKVLFETDGRVATITFNDPDKRNPISDAAMVEAVLGALDKVQRDRNISVCILTGAGSAFSSGGDIKEMREQTGMFAGGPIDIAEGYMGGIQRIPLALYNLDVPTIAAVNGPAIGAGCDVTFMCDFRIASTKAKFGEVFVNLGIIPGDAGSWFLPRRLPYQLAADMTFTGRIVEADEALEKGLVMKVVEPDALVDEARAFAGVIAKKPPRTVRQAKRLLRASERLDLKTFLEMAAANQALAHKTEDHLEAINAFLEKREPDFKGK